MEVLHKRGYSGFEKIEPGGHATVYRAQKGDMNFAIKVVRIENEDRTKLDDDLKRELIICNNIRHPNCIQVLETFRSRTKLYTVMEFMPNGTVGAKMRQPDFELCEWNIKLWFCPIAMAIKYLHASHIAHRAIKLDNILLDKNYNPMLTDFGFSRFVRTKRGHTIKSDTYCGSTSYNPPEVLQEKPYNPYKADIWSLGVALFILFNRDYPFDRTHGRKKMLAAQLAQEYKMHEKVEETVSPEAKKLIAKMLDPSPKTRIKIADICSSSFFPCAMRGDDGMFDLQKKFEKLKIENSHPNQPTGMITGQGPKTL